MLITLNAYKFYMQSRWLFLITYRLFSWMVLGLCMLAFSAQAANSGSWEEVRQDVTLRITRAQAVADDLAVRRQTMEQRLEELKGQSDQLHHQIGDLERQISQDQPRVAEMRATLNAQIAQRQSTIDHRTSIEAQLSQERAAVQELYEGHARCMHDAWIFNVFCGPFPAEQESVQIRERQMAEWERIIAEDSRSIEELNQKIRDQFGQTFDENWALNAAREKRDQLVNEITSTAKNISVIRAGWMCINTKVDAIHTRISNIEGLMEEQKKSFINAALTLLQELESNIQVLQQPNLSVLPETCQAA